LEITGVDLLSDEVILLTYKNRKEFVESNPTNNLSIAAWTTSLGRLRLLEALQAVTKGENHQEKLSILLYYDTDSVIYALRKGYSDPLNFLQGQHLGELKDEKLGLNILEFSCAGPKNYGLLLEDKKTGIIFHELKIRGISLDYSSCQKLQYETFREKCLLFGTDDEKIIYMDYDTFLRPDFKTGNVYTQPMKKMFRPVMSKGIVDNTYKLLDFGTLNIKN
jgi:hypothetical protein